MLGLLGRGCSKYLAIFGHGSTALAEVIRVYESHGLVQCLAVPQRGGDGACRNRAALDLWRAGAVVTSIGPGALQAMAGSLAAASNGVGVYHIYGDETTHGEGYNMQQVPKPAAGPLRPAHRAHGTLLRAAHARGAARGDAPRRGGGVPSRQGAPFFLLLPINTQPQMVGVNLAALPERPVAAAAAARRRRRRSPRPRG